MDTKIIPLFVKLLKFSYVNSPILIFYIAHQKNSPILILEGIGVHLDLKIMGKVGVYYLVEDIDLTPAIVLPDLNPCEVALAILW